MANQELVMETTHGRKGKCKTEFKAVVNKVLKPLLLVVSMPNLKKSSTTSRNSLPMLF